jgi:hypothetical protein
LLNLAFSAQTNGPVQFELIGQLGQTVMLENLSEGQTFAQYSTANLANGVYYWRLRDSERTIKSGKLVIMK